MAAGKRMGRQLAAAVAVPAGVLALLALLLVGEVRYLLSTSAWVDHTDQVIAAAHLVEKQALDRETGLRGFLITRRAEFLEPYVEAGQSLTQQLSGLEKLVADNPPQGERIAGIRAEIERWNAYAEGLLKQSPDSPVQTAYDTSLRGKQLMDQLRDRLGAFILVEETLRSERLRSATNATHLVFVSAAVATILFAIALALFTRRQIANAVREHQEALQARETFLTLASHELRTPLTALQLQLATVRKMAGQPREGDAVERRLEQSQRQVARLNTLVTDLLDVDRLRARRSPLERTHIDLSALVREVVDRMEPRTALAGSPVRLQIDHAVEGWWDRARIDQALEAIVSNALKFGPNEPVDVLVRSDGQTASVEVTDHGIGIRPEDLDRIFAPFERAVPLRNYGGLGLGLFLAREIARSHDGDLVVRSSAGEGTTFSLRLPIVREVA